MGQKTNKNEGKLTVKEVKELTKFVRGAMHTPVAAVRSQQIPYKERQMIDAEFVKAAKEGDFELIKKLFNRGAYVNANDGDQITALSWAAENAHLEIVKFLVEKGADVNVKGIDGWDGIMSAANHGHAEMVIFLIEHGADAAKALEIAKYRKNSVIIELIENIGKRI